MTTVLGLAVAALLWVTAGWKLRQFALGPDRRATGMLARFFGSLAVTVTIVAVPRVGNRVLEPLLGPNAQSLVRNLLFLVCLYTGLAFLLYAAGRDSGRRRRLLLDGPTALSILVMAIGWYSVPADLRGGAFSDTSQPGRVVYYAVGIVAITYLTAGLGTWVTYLNARRADPVAARGLSIAVIAFVLQIPFFAVPRLLSLVLAGLGHRPPHVLGAVSDVAGVLIIGMWSVGFAWPTIHARWAAWALWRRHRRLTAAMQPLWDDLSATFPDHVLHRGQPGRTRAWRGTHDRFYRCVVECRDGLVVLGRLAGESAAPGDIEAEAVLVADTLTVARDGGPITPGPPGHVIAPPLGETVEDDARALARLTDALYRSASAPAAARNDDPPEGSTCPTPSSPSAGC